jgi:hypothetical protein
MQSALDDIDNVTEVPEGMLNPNTLLKEAK